MASLAAFGVLAGGGAVAASHGPGGSSSDPSASASASTKKDVKKLKKRVAALEATVAGLQTTAAAPAAGEAAGQVTFFNATSCPSGWSAVTAAEGRYLVGLNPGGTLGGTRGTALNDLANRAVGQHTHTVNDPGHTHTSGSIGLGDTDAGVVGPHVDLASNDLGTYAPTISSSVTGITINDAGAVAGTNAPYLQLLVCQKG